MKMRTFYKKIPLFINNSILHTYKKTQTSNMSFIKNSIFGTFRDPCPDMELMDDHMIMKQDQIKYIFGRVSFNIYWYP